MNFVQKRDEERWKVTEKNNNVTEKDRRRVVRYTVVQNTQYKLFSTTKNYFHNNKIFTLRV